MLPVKQKSLLGGAIHDIHNKKVLICLSEIKNFDFYSYLVLIVSRLLSQNNTIIILEINSATLSNNFLPKWHERNKFIRHKKLSLLYRQIFYDFLCENQIFPELHKLSIDNDYLQVSKCKTISDLTNEDIDIICKTAILSIFGTHITKSIEVKTRLTMHESNLINHMKNTYNQIVSNFDINLINEIDIMVVLNGRMPDQSALRKIANTHSKEIYFFEHGGILRESFHFEKFMPQNVIQMQKTFLKRNSGRYEHVLEQFKPAIDDWIEERQNLSNKANLQEVTDLLEIFQNPNNQIALICTSSLNEHELYSGSSTNSSQAEMVESLILKLVSEGFQVILRIHPNEKYNHWINLITLVKKINHLNLKIIYPWDSISTYGLVKISDVVIVWDSTVGIESYLLGKPVFILNDSFYSEILGLSRITLQELRSSNRVFVFPKVDLDKGRLAIILRLFNGTSIFDLNFNQKLLPLFKNKLLSHEVNINNINSDDRDLFCHSLTYRYQEFVNFRFPIRLERKFQKFFGNSVSNLVLRSTFRIIQIKEKICAR